MRGYRAFLGKEIKEHVRNYKFLILMIVFAIVGLLSPLTAKFLPVIIENLMDENITIILQEPTYIDSWIQFFSNTNQMSFIVLLLLFSPILSKEFEKGTFVHMVTKGLSRQTIMFSKATILFSGWTMGYWMSALITLGYTHFYFPDNTVEGLFLPLLGLYSFGLLLLTVLLLGATWFKNTFGSLMTVGGFVLISFIADIVPAIHKWNPLQLATRNTEILVLKAGDRLLLQAFGTNTLLLILLLILSIHLFKKKNIS